MQIFDKPDQVIPICDRGVALGFFDGVHRGHLELIRTLIYNCRQPQLLPSVFTFPLHPESVLFPDAPFTSYLSTLDERLQMLADSGIQETHLQNFDLDFAKIEPQEFLDKILDKQLHTRLIVVGQDYRFGHLGRGDVAFLKAWAIKKNIRVIVVTQVSLMDDKVSSSRIRAAIGQGDLKLAASLLGRPYSLGGVVETGRGLGKKMGFPTANLPVPSDQACPAYGVYATRTHWQGRTYESVTNIGIRPTVDSGEARPLIETYIYHENLSLYDQTIQVDFLQMIRPEKRFDSVLQLSAQIGEDLQTVREWHDQAEQCYEKARIHDISLYLLPTRRFAQSVLHLVMYSRLEPRQACCQALLARVLTASCRRFPNRTTMASALDNLYGSTIEANLEKQGDLLSVNILAEGLMQWTDGSSPFRETCRLLFDLLFDPLLDDQGLFDASAVEAERQNLILEQTARENDRSKFAYDQCLALFCGQQVQGIIPAGDIQILEKITRQDLQAAYQDFLKNTRIAFYLGGRIDQATINICLDGMQRFPDTSRPVFRPAEYPSPFTPERPASVIEHKNLEQARIVIALSGMPPYFSNQSITATILNSMLGGDVHSLLFDVVREKLGLAYSVYSLNQRCLSALLIVAGVALNQVEPAVKAVVQQIENLALGHFEPSLFDRACQMIETAVLSVSDDLPMMIAQNINGRLYGRTLTCRESLSLLRTAQPAQVIALAAQLKINTCYVLTSPDQNPVLEILTEAAISEGEQP